MEDEATIPEGTALDNEQDALARIGAILDMDESSEGNSEQEESNVEQPVDEEDESTEKPSEADDQIFVIDGEELSISEVRDRMMMRAEFTRKTQEIAEQRRVYQEAQFDRNKMRGEALQALEALKQNVAVQFRMMEQPDFNFLAENDPAEFVRQKHIWETREAAVRQLYDAEVYLKNQMAEYEAQQHQAALQESHSRFMAKYPEMQDAAKSSEVLSEITGFLLDTGFSQEEIQSVNDFRIIDILYQLVRMNKTQKAVPDVVAKMEKKPTLSIKENSKKVSQSDYDSNRAKFNKTQSKGDALALIKGLL